MQVKIGSHHEEDQSNGPLCFQQKLLYVIGRNSKCFRIFDFPLLDRASKILYDIASGLQLHGP
jgi:hypothetical protein